MTVQLSALILRCAWCDGEILNADQIRETPGGQMVCEDCAVNGYVDTPLEWEA